jgi:hypothetical protein
MFRRQPITYHIRLGGFFFHPNPMRGEHTGENQPMTESGSFRYKFQN